MIPKHLIVIYMIRKKKRKERKKREKVIKSNVNNLCKIT